MKRSEQSTIVHCIKCGKATKLANSQLNIKGRGKFCSKKCRYPQKISITCPICNKEKLIPPAWKDRTKYCSMKCKAKAFKDLKRGEGNPAWKGGVTRLGHSIRTCDKYIKHRLDVIIRDGGKCVECGSYKKLEVHHKKELWKLIKEFMESGNTFHPEHNFFYDKSNLVTLCHKCHKLKKV